MKIAALLILLSGCSQTILSTRGKVYDKDLRGYAVRCSTLQEVDVSKVRQDKNKTGCWCLLPPVQFTEVSLALVFNMAPDSYCHEDKEKPNGK